MKLKKAQREVLLQWVGEGLESDEINKRAAKFKPRFSVLRSQVVYYRKSRHVQLDALKNAGEMVSLTSGLALKENRVRLLQELANKLKDDLFMNGKLWLLQVKGIGGKKNFERVEYYDFNSSEVAQLRGVLDDIASEVGGRVSNVDLSTKGKPIKGYVGITPDVWKKTRPAA